MRIATALVALLLGCAAHAPRTEPVRVAENEPTSRGSGDVETQTPTHEAPRPDAVAAAEPDPVRSANRALRDGEGPSIDLDGDGRDEDIEWQDSDLRVGGVLFSERIFGEVGVVDVDRGDRERELLAESCADDECSYLILAYRGGAFVRLFDVAGTDLRLDGEGRLRVSHNECGEIRTTHYQREGDTFRETRTEIDGEYDPEICNVAEP